MENNQNIPIEEKGEIVLYQPDDNVRLEVRLQDDTVWLTQLQMAELFKSTKQNISLHVNNIFREGELAKNSVVKECLTTASDGKNYRTKYYNLDVIISVGYRVKSSVGTRFRQWANAVLKDYLLWGMPFTSRSWLYSRSILGLMPRMIEVTRAQVEKYIGKSHRTITTHLNNLMDLGVIQRNGNKFDPSHTYSLIIKELQG